MHGVFSKIKQAFLVRALESPPYGFNVLIVQREVRVFPVHPHPQIIEVFVHYADVFGCILPAFMDKFFDAVIFDFRLGFETELFLDLVFNRQAVRVIPRLVPDFKALHALLPQSDVFHDFVQRRAHVDVP